MTLDDGTSVWSLGCLFLMMDTLDFAYWGNAANYPLWGFPIDDADPKVFNYQPASFKAS